MECINCKNCKENQPTYYCIKENAIVTNMEYKPEEKTRSGWKKGNKEYEDRRRILRNVE